ncbi:MAG: hypothetical protein WC292_07125 [Clostridia bacterium]
MAITDLFGRVRKDYFKALCNIILSSTLNNTKELNLNTTTKTQTVDYSIQHKS